MHHIASFAVVACLSAAHCLAATPPTASYPDKAVRLLVLSPPGGGSDITARAIAQKLTDQWRQNVIVDNRAGAGGVIGMEITARAPADGYTMTLGSIGPVAVAPSLYSKPPYNPVRDFTPLARTASALNLLVVHPSVPAHTVKEFIAYAKEKKGALNYGSGGVGATPFLAVELFKSMVGFDAVHVPYKGGAPALADLMAGQISFMIENVPGTLPYVKDGKLRALAITSAKRLPLVPDLPTMQEAGVAGYEMVGWNGIFVPKNTPADIVGKLNAVLAKLLNSDAVKTQMAKLGAEPVGNPQPEFAAFVKSESIRWGKIIRENGIKPE